MTAYVAPQEDRLRLPAAWTRLLLARRGRAVRDFPELKPEPKALDAMREHISANRPELDEMLQIDENRDWADDARAYLAGEANARGAAAVATLLPLGDAPGAQAPGIRAGLDAWTIEHGLPFATTASVERLALDVHRTTSSGERRLLSGLDTFPHMLGHNLRGGVLILRGRLAEASEAEYAAACAAVAPHRTEPARRMAATLLLPEERAWNDEASADFGQHKDWGWSESLFWNWVRTPEQLTASKITDFNRFFIRSDNIAALADGLGTACLPILTATLDRAEGPNAAERRLLLAAIAALPGDEAMDRLLHHLHEADYFGAATTAVGHFPVRALRRLALAVADAPAERRRRLTGLAALIDPETRGHLDETERAVVEDLLASTSAVSGAAVADLPPLLAAPPWTRKRSKRKALVVEGLEAPAEIVLDWAEGERERWLALRHPSLSNHDEERWREIAEHADRSDSAWYHDIVAFAGDDLAEQYKDKWIGKVGWWVGDIILRRIVARFEGAVADRAVGAIAEDRTLTEWLLPIRSLAAARLAADRLQLKSTRPAAAAWFDRHGAEAATFLVPDALGPDKSRRRSAESALAHLRLIIGPDAVRDAAKPYGAEAFEAFGELMDTDPLDPIGVKIPKPGAWANAAMLPQVHMAGRATTLPAASVPHLVTVLALGTPELPYAGVDVAAEACDRESLRRFSWALFEQWIGVGAPAKDAWALTQLAHFADDATVSRLTAMIREWPGQGQHKRAITGLQVLGVIGSEAALRAVHGISQKVKFKALKEEAGRQIKAVADGLGLSTEQLADRLVPDFGLGDEALVLDYGPRRFTVVFDEQLKPYVRDETGKPRKSLPKPGAKDDAELADAAYKRFAQLKKDLRTASADQVDRLEAAMVNARTWTGEEFRRFFATHPLVKHLARRLVWQADGTGFRIAEDGTLGDAADDAFTLPDDATVRLAHPMLMDPEEVKAWGDVLADYEILQPFDQLGRPVMELTEDEHRTGRLERFEHRAVEVGRLLGLTKRGWRRAAPEDGGVEPGICFPLPDGWFVTVSLEPGIWVGMIAENPVQKLHRIDIRPREDYWGGDPGEPVPDGLSRLTLSEILTDLERLADPERR